MSIVGEEPRLYVWSLDEEEDQLECREKILNAEMEGREDLKPCWAPIGKNDL